jgi:tetratricopeptide (TPR) repeat protein
LSPRDAEVYNNLGVVYNASRDFKRAISAYQHALAIAPEYWEARYNLAICYLGLNARNSALREYALLKQAAPQLADNLYEVIYAGQVINARAH